MSRRAQPRVLLVLKIPPPFGGGELMHQMMAAAFESKYKVLSFNRKTHSKSTQGRFLLSNLIFGSYFLLRVSFTCLLQRPKIVFIWLPKDWYPFLRTLLLAHVLKKMGIRVIGDLHGMDFDFSKRRFRQVHSADAFSAVRVLSGSIARSLRANGYPHHLAVIDNGLEAPSFVHQRQPRHPQEMRLLYMGAISAAKGFADVVKWLDLLEAVSLPWTLSVVGEWVNADFREEMLTTLRAKAYSSRVIFTGVLIDEAKWQALIAHDLLIHFSSWDGQPLTIIEAMAAAVPTIARPVGAIPEMIQDGVNGFLIDDLEEAVQVTRQLYAGEISLSAIANNARELFQRRFRHDIFIGEIERLIARISNSSGFSLSKTEEMFTMKTNARSGHHCNP